MQFKTRYHCKPIRMAKIQNTDNTVCWQRCRVIGTLMEFGRQMAISYNDKHRLTMCPAVVLLGNKPTDLKAMFTHKPACKCL